MSTAPPTLDDVIAQLSALTDTDFDDTVKADLLNKLKVITKDVKTESHMLDTATKLATDRQAELDSVKKDLEFQSRLRRADLVKRDPLKIVKELREFLDVYEVGMDPEEFIASYEAAVRSRGLDEEFLVLYFHKVLESSSDKDVVNWSKVNHSGYIKKAREQVDFDRGWHRYSTAFVDFFDPSEMVAKAESDLDKYQFKSEMTAREFVTGVKKLALAANPKENVERILRKALGKLPPAIAGSMDHRHLKAENDFINALEHKLRYLGGSTPSSSSASSAASTPVVRAFSRKSPITCHNCGGPNHIQANCLATQQDNSQSHPVQSPRRSYKEQRSRGRSSRGASRTFHNSRQQQETGGFQLASYPQQVYYAVQPAQAQASSQPQPLMAQLVTPPKEKSRSYNRVPPPQDASKNDSRPQRGRQQR